MGAAQTMTFWVSASLVTAATVLVFLGVALRREKHVLRARAFALAGLLSLAVTVATRWYASGHFPYVGNYEGALVGAFLVVAAYVASALVWRGTAVSGIVMLPAALVTLGWGLVQPIGVSPVTPVYQSGWLLVHFTFAWTTYAVYLVAAGFAVGQLVRERARRKGREPIGIPAWLPDDAVLDDRSVKLVAFGFLLNAVTLASGSIWAYRLWGTYWNWDPVETWTLATWLGYGFYLHAKFTLGWNRTRLAWVAIISLFGVSMATWGVQLVPTSYHLFRDLGGTMTGSRPQ